MSIMKNDFDSIFVYQSPELFGKTAEASKESSEFVKNNINTIVKCIKIAGLIPGLGLITAGFKFYQAYRFSQMSNDQFQQSEKNDAIVVLIIEGIIQAIGFGFANALLDMLTYLDGYACLTAPLRPVVLVKCSPAA